MEEQKLPIGIDSEIEHVESEINRVDAIFTVATGPMGHQKINYHIIDGERDQHRTEEPFPHIVSVAKSSGEKSSIKSQSSILQQQSAIDVIDGEILNNFQDEYDNYSNIEIQRKTSNENKNRKARFSLPEIDSSTQQITKYPTKKVGKLLKYIQIEQLTPYRMKNVNDDEKNKPSSSSFSNEPILDIPQACRPIPNNTLKQQAETSVPFHTLNELTQHNDSIDAWICIFDHIYDITSLLQKIQSTKLHQQLIGYAGQDISSFFDEQTREPRTRIDPHNHQLTPIIPNLSVLESFGPPFWQTKDFFIGRLTQHPRTIRLIHQFSPNHPYILEVAEEETIGQIAKKFSKYNSHIFSYIWRYNGQVLDFNKTLTENGLPNEEFLHDKYGWRSDNENCPTIVLVFSDDLTIA